MKSKYIFPVLIILAIIVLVFFARTESFSISDYEGSMTGSTNMPIMTANEFITGLSSSSFYLYHETPTTVDVGEKIYYKVRAYEESDSEVERQLYQNIKAGQACGVRQMIYDANSDPLIGVGSWYTQFNHHPGGIDGNYYELNHVMWLTSTEASPKIVYTKIFYFCDEGLDVLLDTSKIFSFDAVAEKEACEARDNSFCFGNRLAVKDYTYIDGLCEIVSTFEDNEECFERYMIETCEAAGSAYDPETKACESDIPEVMTCDGSPIDTLKCEGEVEMICDATGNWLSTGGDDCKQAITCDGEPLYTIKCIEEKEMMCTRQGWTDMRTTECMTQPPLSCSGTPIGTKQCFGETEAQCIGGQWVELDTDTCKTISVPEGANIIIIIFLAALFFIIMSFAIFSPKNDKKNGK